MKKYFKNIKFWTLLLIPLSIFLTLSAKYINGFADFYYSHVYKYISLIFNHITGIFPFSLAEIIVIAFPLTAMIYIILLGQKAYNRFKRSFKYTLHNRCTAFHFYNKLRNKLL